jgi:hypothetical protein
MCDRYSNGLLRAMVRFVLGKRKSGGKSEEKAAGSEVRTTDLGSEPMACPQPNSAVPSNRRVVSASKQTTTVG